MTIKQFDLYTAELNRHAQRHPSTPDWLYALAMLGVAIGACFLVAATVDAMRKVARPAPQTTTDRNRLARPERPHPFWLLKNAPSVRK